MRRLIDPENTPPKPTTYHRGANSLKPVTGDIREDYLGNMQIYNGFTWAKVNRTN